MTDAGLLSLSDVAVLRDHGIAWFANRAIFAAQPPMSEAAIVAIAAQSVGPLPQDLLDLWRCTAGGRLAYDLTVNMAGNEEAISWCELFYNGSKGYRDLAGWIDHELELASDAAEENGTETPTQLGLLPIGGFEYCDRIYVVTQPGPKYGAVYAWKHGLPPAWEYQLHEDSVARIANSLREAFAALHLDDDPLAPTSQYPASDAFLDYLETRVDEFGLPRELADAAIREYSRAVVTWREAFADGTLADKPALILLAIAEAIRTDDGSLIQQLAQLPYDLNRPMRGSAPPIVIAAQAGAVHAIAALLANGAGVPANILERNEAMLPASTLLALATHGAAINAAVIAMTAALGNTDGANALAQGWIAEQKVTAAASTMYQAAANSLRADLANSLERVRAGKLGHYLGEAGLAQRIANLDGFALPTR